MIDDKLAVLKDAVDKPGADYAPVRIDRIKISNYKYFHGDFTFPTAGTFNGKNVLLYGENGREEKGDRHFLVLLHLKFIIYNLSFIVYNLNSQL